VPSAEGTFSDVISALAALGDSCIGGAQVFGTWTFRDPPASPGSPGYTSVGHGGAVRALGSYLGALAEVYPDVSAFVAMEPHADRVAPHFHGLLAGLPAGVAAAIDQGRRLSGSPRELAEELAGLPFSERIARDVFWGRWWQAHGMARLEAVQGDGASLYVAKYSVKGGDDVPFWRIWTPGELRESWVASTHARRRPR